MIASRPATSRPLPRAARGIAGDGEALLVWENELGGLTYEIDGPIGRRFLKWAPPEHGALMRAEADRLAWAVTFTSVPRVVDVGADDTNAWLLTEGLPGDNAVVDRWRENPRTAVRAIGRGLRALHDRLPVAGCRFSWSVQDRLEAVHRRVALLDRANWAVEHAGQSIDDALQAVAVVPGVDLLVVCHGDACAPNTLLDADGNVTGHVDLGTLGTGDRWADLAVATWSTTWNYGPDWEHELLDAYGIAPDPQRTAYYRLLWDLGG